MAEKRMFSTQIVCSDAFLDLPHSAQALYIQLNLKADDDGFVSNPKSVARLVGAPKNDLDLLKEKRFILGFEDTGVICIKHWRVNNTIRWDRYTATAYQPEALTLGIKENGGYTELNGAENGVVKPYGNHMATKRQPSGVTLATQYRLDECSIDESTVLDTTHHKDLHATLKKKRPAFVKPTMDEVYDYCFQNHYFIDPSRFFDYYESNGWHVGKTKMVSWKSALSGWAKREMESHPNQTWWTDNQLNYLALHPDYGTGEMK